MKRLNRQILAALLALALAGTLMAAVVWVVATTQGSRWLLTSAVPLSGVGFSAQKIEGRLIDDLLISGARLELRHQNVEIDRLELRWKPLLLLVGSVAVRELTLQGLRIQDNSPSATKPPTLLWPRVSQFEQLLDARIARLRVTNLVYRRLHEQPLLLASINGSLTWQDALLSLDDLKLQSAFGQISGHVAAGFKQASLTADLALALTQPIAGMDHLSLQVRHGKSRKPETLAGTITLAGSSASRKLLELNGEVGMARDAIHLRRLTLSRTGQKARITADGALSFTAVEPLLSLQVTAAALDLAPQLHLPTNITGTLRFAGSLNNYRGDFSLANRAQGWRAANLSASYQGTRNGLKLTSLKGTLLDGSLAGNMAMNWHNGFAMQALLSGRNLNPARLDPAWQGLANFNATGRLARTGQAPLTGNISASLLESRLHGQALTGELQADFSGKNINLARLALQGNGFDLHASGELNRRITLATHISDFSRLVPGAAGTLQADGWLRWYAGQFTGDLSGTGNRLAYAGAQAAGADLTARFDEGQDHPLHVAASLKNVAYKGYTVDAMALAADGTLQRHTLNATVRSGSSDAQLALAAGYTNGIWQGEITRLAGQDNNGPWRLTAPASFALGAEKASLAPLILSAAGAERLEVAAELSLKPLSGQVRTAWSALNLARANAYLRDAQVKGSSSGKARVGFQSGSMTSLSGNAAASGTFTKRGSSLTLRQSTLTFDGDERGLRAGIDLTVADNGTVKATYASLAPFQPAIPEKGAVTAELSNINLALFKPWLPANTRLEGRISGHAKGNLITGKRIELDEGQPLHVSASLSDVLYNGYALNAVTLAADGTLQHHNLNMAVRSGGSDARLTLAAGYTNGNWKGKITRLDGRDSNGPWRLTAPANFALGAEKASLSPLSISAAGAEWLEVAAELSLKPLSGQVRATWSDINLARANAYLRDAQFKGSSNGTAHLGLQSGTMTSLAGKATASGTFARQGNSLDLRQSMLTFDGNTGGVRVGLDLTVANGATVKAGYASSAPLRLAIPEQGALTAELSGIELALFKPWLPANTKLEGRISAQAKGVLRPGKRFELDGTTAISGGMLHQQRPGGELKLSFSSATAAWGWHGETLAGTLAMTMAEHGQAKGTFQLPLAARFPLALNTKGPLRGTLIGQFHENGIITALFPGLIRESSGELDADLAVNGSWSAPLLTGTVRLSKAGAYLPTAGIHLKDVQLAAHLEKNLIRIDSFRALSGPGHLEGTALISLADWRVIGYKGTLSGDKFQTVHFPELQLLSTPKLTFEGTPQKLTLRGELQLPELKIVGSKSRTVVKPSSDVIREGVIAPPAKSSPLALDVQVRVLLGDKVFVKVAGIDAQLGGGMDLSLTRLDRITSKGEVKVIKGNYRTYGVDLEIVRGRLFFAGGSIDRPSIDVLALRTIGNIRAGVTVSGTLQKPVTKLYSEPAMPDVDVLAYIVLGHPLGSNSQQASLLNQAAGALLTSSQAVALQEQIKSYLGLSTLEIKGGVGTTSGAMGYKPLPVTAPGAIPAAQQAGVTETVFTVGKYLTPQLYISYGKSLFTGGNLFRLRYDLFKHWQIETQAGSGESGADLYYKLEFM